MRTVGPKAMYRQLRFRGGEQHHLAKLQPAPFPGAHVNLTKQIGEQVRAEWPISNVGDASGFAVIRILWNGQILGDNDAFIEPAESEQAIVFGLIPSNMPEGLNNLTVDVYQFDAQNPPGQLLASHPFTVTIPPIISGPELVANSSPSQPVIT